MSFKKNLIINLPWIISAILLTYHQVSGNNNLGIYDISLDIQEYFLLPISIIVITQPFIWKKFNLHYKINLAGWAATFISAFYFTLDANILFFMKTATIYYSSLFSMVLVPILLMFQFGYWLFLLFRYFRLR